MPGAIVDDVTGQIPELLVGHRDAGRLQWVTQLIGEGIESTLSAMQMFHLPGWAALSAGGVEALYLPPKIRKVVIAADNDANGVGQRAALSARNRWAAEGRSVRILLPPSPGEDFNHVLLSRN